MLPSAPAGDLPRAAVVIVNLGTPDAPTPAAVRRYLAEFLADPRVVEAPRWLWWFALNLVILPLRPRRSAHAYAQVWTSEGSPLKVFTERLRAALTRALPQAEVVAAMRYGAPSMPSVLRALRERGVERFVVLPLYPQYSATTTASVFDALAAELTTWRRVPALRFVDDYHAEPAYLDALAESIRAHRAANGANGQLLLFSFHGIPERYVRAGDPYARQCEATARGVVARLELPDDAWRLAYQSRVGREPWLSPYTDRLLAELPAQGVRRVDVVCPGFAADCLETLEEIAIRNAADFRAAGGESLSYVPALNDRDSHVALLADLARRAAGDWL